MRRIWISLAVLVALVAAPAGAKVIDVGASPNPARLGDRVRHTVSVGVTARLDVWVSATGFERPGLGTLPTGTWSYECCPGQTAGTPAWHYRSSSPVTPNGYRFGAVTRARGSFLSTAFAAGLSSGVWIRVT